MFGPKQINSHKNMKNVLKATKFSFLVYNMPWNSKIIPGIIS